MRIKLLAILIISFCATINTSAQTSSKKGEAKLTKTVYFYQFDGAKSLSEVAELKTEVTALKGVTEFKPVFKAEKNAAQIIVVVTEKARTSESEELFEITSLKKILEKKGYKNLEYTIEELPVN